MNAYMNIQVKVLSANAAAQIKALQAQINGLTGSMSAASMASMGMFGARQMSGLTKFGNQLQWTGRQLQYNFTLPLAIAGIAATNFAMENEKAFTRIKKVYGDTTLSAQVMENELNALRGAFEALSNHYGVHQAAVLDIAADWAAAGASGVALARGVEQTLRVMVLGEMEAKAATEALIAIQAQYNLSSAQLVDTIAKLNVVENQTAISMQGLIQGFQRSAGVARSAGVDVDHLAAMLAALVPAAGTAAQAGNALKTILSRLMSPTARASEVMKEMGINLESAAWQSANGAQRLEILAGKFHGLADSQRAVVSETIASRYQINKFEILMDQIYKGLDSNTKGQSRYAQALSATQDRTKYLAQAEKELRAVLESNPQKLQQIWVILQNAMADIIVPLIPVILMAANAIRTLAEKFRDLPPELQKVITFALLFLALFGPLLRYMGSTMTLVGELAWFFGGLAKAGLNAIKVLMMFALWPFSKVAGGLGMLGGGLLKFGAAIWAATRAVFAFLMTRPIIIAVLTAIRAAFMGFGGAILMIWAQAMAKIAMITGPALTAVRAAFMLWIAGLSKLMVLARAVVTLGWVGLVAVTRWVGPVLVAMSTTMWASMVAAAKMGTLAIVVRVRAMWVALVALFANWRVILVGLVTKMWAGIVLIFRTGLMQIGRMMLAALSFLLGPWGLLIAAILGILYLFRDQIAQLIKNIITFFRDMPPGIAKAFQPIVVVFHKAVALVQKGFNALPKGVRDALIAVVNVVAAAARQVYELFSYLNPFAHHSPSLVENVTKGMAEIKKQFGTIIEISGPIKQAYRELKAFGEATKKLLKGMDNARRADDRADLAKVAPGALDEFDALVRRVISLTARLDQLKAAMDSQQTVVDLWKMRLDAANDALDAQRDLLDKLNKVLDDAKDRLAASQDALNNFANTPIKGMKAMEDAIFANEMAQKRLRLEMLRMEEAGQTMDDLQTKMQAVHGMMEFLTGEQTALRDAGAGSEILNVYDQQIDKLGEEAKALQTQQTEYSKLSSELEKLQRQGEIMDLEKSLNFDELTRQIDTAANAVKELTFEQIIAGINKSKTEIAQYTVEVDKANAAVLAQQKAVDAATAARDAISKRYDEETKKLEILRDAYDKVNSTIQDINASLQDMSAAAAEAIRKAEEAAKAGKSALGPEGNFPDVAGIGGLGREGGLGDQSAMIDQFTKDLAVKTGDLLGGFDLFGPVKKKFNELKGWFQKNVGPIFGAVGDAAVAIFGGIDWTKPFRDMDWSWMQTIWTTIKDIWNTGVGWIRDIIALFADDAKEIWGIIQDAGKKIWKEIGPEIVKFKELLGPLGDAFKQIWAVVKPVAAVIGIILLAAIKILVSVLVNVLKPALNLIIDIIKAVLKILRGLIEFVVGVFTGDWSLAWKGIKDVFGGIWDAIWGILKGAVLIIWGAVSGLVEGIVDFFKWLYNVLVGHSIIPDMVKAIIEWFASLPGKAWEALKSLVDKVVTIAHNAWDAFVAANKTLWKTVVTWLVGRAQAAWEALSNFPGKLKEMATKAINWLRDGAVAAWVLVNTWFRGRPQAIVDALVSLYQKVKDVATKAINWFKDGATGAWTAVSTWFSGIGTKVKNAIGNISLFEIGKKILTSLLDGLKHAWETTKDFLSGLGKQIKEIKGPIEKDRKLLTPEGKAIMQSLGIGFEAEWPHLESWLHTVAPGIRDAIVTGITTGVPTGLKSNPASRLAPALAMADARIGASQGSSATQGTGGNEYGTRVENHFHGELVFPNVKDGSDAEEFIKNLEALIGG